MTGAAGWMPFPFPTGVTASRRKGDPVGSGMNQGLPGGAGDGISGLLSVLERPLLWCCAHEYFISMARPKSTTKDSTANLGFEAAAMRGLAIAQRAAILRSPEGNRWLTADKRWNNMDAADWSGSTKAARKGSPEGECGGVHQYGVPPKGNANFAWVQHFIHHLAPTGMAGFVLANGSMSSNQSGEGETRKAIIEADLVDCMVALPGQLFYSTKISEMLQKAA